MNKIVLLFLFSLLSYSFLYGQSIRSFFDAPAIYLETNNMEAPLQDAGLGAAFGYGIGTHNVMMKISGGLTATTDFQAEKFGQNFFFNPFAKAEAGLGLWRTNNSQCGKQEQIAFTLLAKGGVQYNFGSAEANEEAKIPARESFLDKFIGLEFGAFRLLDFRRNSEFFMEGNYSLDHKIISAKIGFRIFFNLRA